MMQLFLFFLLSCMNDYGIHTEKVYEDVIQYEDPGEVWIDSFIQSGETSGVDIVWVVDRSGSMHDNDEKLVAGIAAMMNALPLDIGWRIGIISTDDNESVSNNSFPLVPGDTPQDAEYMLNNLSVSFKEAGFESIITYMDYGAYASTWMRYDASLLAVFVSDEDEQSVNITPAEFVSWIRSRRGFVNVASIVLTDESDCDFNIAPGNNYIDATNSMSGVIIDICSDDWSSGVKDASRSMEPIEYLELTYTPVPETIVVFVNNKEYSDWSYSSDTNILTFTAIPIQGDLVEIGYNIKE